MKQYYILLGGSTTLSLGVGLVSGFFFAKKRLETKYSEISTKEIAESKKFYSLLYKREENSTPESVVENRKVADAVDALQSYQGRKREDTDDTDDPVTVVNNIFVNSHPIEDSDFNYEEELKNRSPDVPYVISRDEFIEAANDYDQITITYYAGDDVLADDKDQGINDTDSTVGDDNLLRFGHGSGDNHIVYIRNEKLEVEFEVLCSKGKFTEEVLGFKHSADHRKIRKFRDEDG